MRNSSECQHEATDLSELKEGNVFTEDPKKLQVPKRERSPCLTSINDIRLYTQVVFRHAFTLPKLAQVQKQIGERSGKLYCAGLCICTRRRHWDWNLKYFRFRYKEEPRGLPFPSQFKIRIRNGLRALHYIQNLLPLSHYYS
jgi:hypothetical protein